MLFQQTRGTHQIWQRSDLKFAANPGEWRVREIREFIDCATQLFDQFLERLRIAFELRESWSRRISTGELNRWFEHAVDANPPPAPSGRRIKLRYITQVKTRPPTFVVFGTRVDQLPDSYRRYLLNSMRRDLKLGPVPMRLSFRAPKNPYQRDR